MSLGYGGCCQKVAEDAEFVLYEYFSFNLNLEDYEKIFDGLIMIRKTSLLEPEQHEKIRRVPNGRRKKFTKIILREVPLDELIDSGDVLIENCSHAWKILPSGVDFIAYCMCRKIFEHYQREGFLPDRCGWFA